MKTSQVEELLKLLDEDISITVNVKGDDQALTDLKKKVEQAGFRGYFWTSQVTGTTFTITDRI